jgi:hypothetical protein
MDFTFHCRVLQCNEIESEYILAFDPCTSIAFESFKAMVSENTLSFSPIDGVTCEIPLNIYPMEGTCDDERLDLPCSIIAYH